jgi:hypothetical protein
MTRSLAPSAFLVAYLTLLSGDSAVAKGPIGGFTADDFSKQFSKLQSAPLADRISAWSQLFLGTPYGLDPLGEGPSSVVDPDPLEDFRRVDCLTYVEQVMALSYSRKRKESLPWLLKLRYETGKPQHQYRYYTMAKGWIGANIARGLLKDITQSIGGKRVKTVSVDLEKRRYWKKEFKERFELHGDSAPKGRAVVPFIPLARAIKMVKRFPHASLMHVVRAPVRRSPFLISHVGLIIHRNGRVYFRHASGSKGRRKVEDRLLSNYLKMLKLRFNRPKRRPVMGVNLVEILQQQSPSQAQPPTGG